MFGKNKGIEVQETRNPVKDFIERMEHEVSAAELKKLKQGIWEEQKAALKRIPWKGLGPVPEPSRAQIETAILNEAHQLSGTIERHGGDMARKDGEALIRGLGDKATPEKVRGIRDAAAGIEKEHYALLDFAEEIKRTRSKKI
ncbi:MAG: hypothetical protein KGI73_01635 [Patescibacteria group bacterium]|nr:hypothetical protein [Patescibacteria group bacterium]